MYDVMIVGCGYVGSAIKEAFKEDNITIIDPKLNKDTITNNKNKSFDIIFVCVDTPKNENFKTLDKVLKEINETFKNVLVVSKSTASPLFYEKSKRRYININLVHSPEYLSHWNNINDFMNQAFCIVGGTPSDCHSYCNILSSRLPNLKVLKITDIKTASLVKYSENAFLALKVTFANELFKIHKKLKCSSSFGEFADLLGTDPRIGHSHFEVPGRDKKFGWGGHCFDKDIFELEKLSNSSLIKFLRKLNKFHRKD